MASVVTAAERPSNNAAPSSADSTDESSGPIELSVVVVAEHVDLEALRQRVKDCLSSLPARTETLIVTTGDAGFGAALTAAFEQAAGDYVLTFDPQLVPSRTLVEQLWNERDRADVTIASRYVPGGRGATTLSRVINRAFSIGLSVPIADLSSSIRLYRTAVLRDQQFTATDTDILPQIVVHAFAEGWHVREVPFVDPRPTAPVPDHLVRGGIAHLRTFGRLWLLRNSILAADYDDRAYDSRIFLQRYWQRARYRHATELVAGEGAVLDVGCGSSRIISSLPPGSVAVDILQRKLRYARRFGKPLVRGSGFALPFADGSFPCVLCSQVIEHVPKESPILDELVRVLRPGGRLVLGTPDYANWQWVYIEKLYGMVPGGYKDEHISHYTNEELRRLLKKRGLVFEDERYILQGELIQAYRKPR